MCLILPKKELILPNKKIEEVKITKSFTREDLAEFVTDKYMFNCTQFTVDYTKLFVENNGVINRPYKKQWEFMNTLSPKDRVTVIIKSRQCLVGNSYVTISENSDEKICDLYHKNYRGKCLTYDSNYNLVKDEIIDIWQTGEKDVYKYTFSNDTYVVCTKDHQINTLYGFKKACELTNTDLIPFLSIDLELKFISLKEIEYIGKEMTYDLTTKYHHSYIANGIHVHNSGFSTSVVARAFHDCYFGKVPDIVIVSATKTQAVKVMRRIKQCFLDLPEPMQPTFLVDQAQEIILANKCRIVSLSSNPSSMRGWTGVFMLDEYAMHTEKDSEEIYEACYPATTKGGRIICLSTPFGTKGMYYKLATKDFTEISGNKNARNARKFFVHWKDVPFIKKAVEEDGLFDGLPPEMIDQEYELNFREDSNNESFFPKDFVLEHFLDKSDDGFGKDDDRKIVHTYSDIGLTWDYINDLEKPLPENSVRIDLIEKYAQIFAGWDIASTANDSVLIIRGVRKDNMQKSEIIGEFYVNRIPMQSNLKKFDSRFESAILQWKYIKRIIEVLQINKLNLDKTGMGRSVYDHIMAQESSYYKTKVIGTVYSNNSNTNWKFDSFVLLKQMMASNNLKRVWIGSRQDNEMLLQMNNLKRLSNTLQSNGRAKDDYPNALMLSVFSKSETTRPRVLMI